MKNTLEKINALYNRLKEPYRFVVILLLALPVLFFNVEYSIVYVAILTFIRTGGIK